MKNLLLLCIILCTFNPGFLAAQGNDLDKGQVGYVPSAENIANREWFRNAHFGMFIHWGVSSVLGKEIGWALSGQDIGKYKENIHTFNPQRFDAGAVVKLAKDAGMKYITFTTRHHDSFSMFNTKYSDWSKRCVKTTGRRMPKTGNQAVLLLFAYRFLPDRLLPGNRKKGKRN